MDQITEKINEINKLIAQTQNNFNSNYKSNNYIIETQFKIKIYIHQLMKIKSNKHAIKYGSKYETFRTLINLLTMLLGIITILLESILIPTNTVIKFILIAFTVITELIISKTCLNKIDDNLSDYYDIFRNKQLSSQEIDNEISYAKEKHDRLEKKIKENSETSKQYSDKINELTKLKQELESIKENIINEVLNTKQLDEYINEDTKKLLKKYPQN